MRQTSTGGSSLRLEFYCKKKEQKHSLMVIVMLRRTGQLKMRDRKMRTVRNAGTEIARLENMALDCKGRKM